MGEYLGQQPEVDTTEARRIGVGSLVELRLEDEILQLHLYEERPMGGTDEPYEAISIDSPIGKAILNHSVGDLVTYKTPSGKVFTLEVCAVIEVA